MISKQFGMSWEKKPTVQSYLLEEMSLYFGGIESCPNPILKRGL